MYPLLFGHPYHCLEIQHFYVYMSRLEIQHINCMSHCYYALYYMDIHDIIIISAIQDTPFWTSSASMYMSYYILSGHPVSYHIVQPCVFTSLIIYELYNTSAHKIYQVYRLHWKSNSLILLNAHNRWCYV